jgi:NAD+-dependent secondary alcohol dehydrogenase Adh1
VPVSVRPDRASHIETHRGVGGAGVCRTDLHILEGQGAEAMGPELPYVTGHENAGWVQEVGDGVTDVPPATP